MQQGSTEVRNILEHPITTDEIVTELERTIEDEKHQIETVGDVAYGDMRVCLLQAAIEMVSQYSILLETIKKQNEAIVGTTIKLKELEDAIEEINSAADDDRLN